MRVGLGIGVSMIDSRWLVGRDDSSRSRGQLRRCRTLNATKTVNSGEVEYETYNKTVLTHVARCGLDEETQQTDKSFNSRPEEYVHGRTLPIMLAQMIG